MQKIYCRTAPSLGAFEDTPEHIWGTPEYEGDREEPCVFFGLYGLPDFYSLWRHKGKKYILWCGSDITHFINGYWLDQEGKIRISPHGLANWISVYCESWVENNIEQEELRTLGIESSICPSFLGDITKFNISYKNSKRPKLYTSVSGDDFELYGWDKIPKLAKENPFAQFHLYGNIALWPNDNKNVVVHGRVFKEQMNQEIKEMQGALRLTKFDGASEIIVKAMFMGQYAFSFIDYPFVNKISEIEILKDRKEPNNKGREWWLKNVNQYPWNKYADRNT